MENARTPARSQDPAERMQFAPPLIIALCVLVHQEQTETPKSAVSLLSASVIPTVLAKEPVSVINVLMSAVYLMSADKTQTAELRTTSQDVSVYPGSQESQ